MAKTISASWAAICDALSDKYSSPLPKELLMIGDPKTGWHVIFNNTGNAWEGTQTLECNGWPIGIASPTGGVMISDDVASEDALIEWARGLGN